MANIQAQKALWEKHGSSDPLWAVLTVPGTEGGRWKAKDFLASGVWEIREVLRYLKSRKLTPKTKARALDFGCGAGRLSQALAAHFKRVDGVDISGSMLVAAKALKPKPNVHFHLNATADLKLFKQASFDFIYTSIVLQHIPGELGYGYLKEFLRVLKPGGLLVFQVPERDNVSLWRHWRYELRLRTRLRELATALGLRQSDGKDTHRIPMNMYPASRLEPFIEKSGGKVFASAWNNSTDPNSWNGYRISASEPPGLDYPSRFWVVGKNK